MSDNGTKSLSHITWSDLLFQSISLFLIMSTLICLLGLVVNLAIWGWPILSWDFLMNFPSRHAHQAGILSAWVGTCAVMLVTVTIALPLGIGSGIYLEEYAPKNWFTSFIELTVSNLAGVPSIVYGLLALGVFVYGMGLGRSILTAGLTLALLVLPIIIVSTREALRSVPQNIREAVWALGSSQLQLIVHHLVPYSMSGIATGSIIALSRAIGETAPLITIGALTFIAFLPASPFQWEFPFVSFEWMHDAFTVMPIQMFNWISRPGTDFLSNASATGFLLIAMTVIMNACAIILRNKARKNIKW